MSRRAKGNPFNLKSGNTTSFKMMGSSSPVKAVDVLVDNVSIGTGSDAREKARNIEAENKANVIAAQKEENKTGEYVHPESKSVGYTGDDALVVAKKSGASGKTLRAIAEGVLGTKKNPYFEGTNMLSGDQQF